MPMFAHFRDGALATTDELVEAIKTFALTNAQTTVMFGNQTVDIPDFFGSPDENTLISDTCVWRRVKGTSYWRCERRPTRLPPRKLSA